MMPSPARETVPLRRRTDTHEPLQSAAELPADLVEASGRRLVGFIALVAFMFALMDVLYRTVWSEDSHTIGRVLSAVMVGYSIVLGVYLGRRPRSAGTIVALGVSYEVLVCLAIAIMENWTGQLGPQPAASVSWTTTVILFFPLLVPSTPRRTIVASLVAASMNPLGYGICWASQQFALPGPDMLLSIFLPPYLAAAVALVGSRVVYQMGEAVRDARELGSYQLVERLGEGGMGEVWRARHRMLIRPAAVKLIRLDTEGASESQAVKKLTERFELEAQATAALESPHTVQLYDFGVSDDGTFYYAMELLEGIDLERLVERFGSLPPERVVYLLLQVCDSLADAHRRGLVHRDIKPANLFLSRRAQRFDFVRVLDFGLVKASQSFDLTARQDGRNPEVRGTPAYLAPEMVEGASLDGRADLYAVGCVAFWLLTGRLVFDEATPMMQAIAHSSDEPEPPSDFTELPVPADLERVIMDCLRKAPDDRPPDAATLAKRLASCELGGRWDDERAERWWRTHLPELARDASLELDRQRPALA